MMILNDDDNPTLLLMLILTGTGNAEEGFWTLDTPSRIPRAACPFCCASPERSWMLGVGYYLLWKRLWDLITVAR
jgi:hypothetical protein